MEGTSRKTGPNLKNIEPKKLAFLLDLVKEMEGKNMDQRLNLFMNANKKLSEQNLSFSSEESDIIMEIMTKSMSAKERQQFDMIRNMMAKR